MVKAVNWWSLSEDELLRKLYFSESKDFIMSKIMRCWSGIRHRAVRIGLKRDKKFQYEGMINNTLNNNPMKNPVSRLKCSVSNTKNGIKKTRDKNRMIILNNNNFVCESCGEVFDARKLVIHHIDGDRHNNVDSNFMILCFSCHSKIHYFDGAKLSYDIVKSVKSVGVEETFDLHTPIYNNFILGNKFLSHNSGKSCLAITLALDIMNKPITIEDICFTTDELLKRAREVGKSHVLLQDEQIFQLGVGSMRESNETQTLQDTVRKFGLSMVFCSPTSREHSTAHYVLEMVCMNRKKRLSKVAIIGAGGQYMGYFVIKVISDKKKLWKEYEKRKDEFIESVLMRNLQRLSLDDMSASLKGHKWYKHATTKEQLKVITVKLFPTITTQEVSMIVENLMLMRKIEGE